MLLLSLSQSQCIPAGCEKCRAANSDRVKRFCVVCRDRGPSGESFQGKYYRPKKLFLRKTFKIHEVGYSEE